MIRNESDYQQAVARVEAERKRLAGHAKAWKSQGYTAAQVARLREPLKSFRLQLEEEVRSYERLKRGQFDEFENLQGLGQVLIGLRIARGMTYASSRGGWMRARRRYRVTSATSTTGSRSSGRER